MSDITEGNTTSSRDSTADLPGQTFEEDAKSVPAEETTDTTTDEVLNTTSEVASRDSTADVPGQVPTEEAAAPTDSAPTSVTATDTINTETNSPFVTVELPVFNVGDKNRGVFIASTLLQKWGYYPEDLAPTSEFNDDVLNAVKKFQEFFRIPINGQMDSAFWNAFFTESYVKEA
jgi:peptidoglycan hydrolase-like protein with peptidoglycan-binding domain